MTETPLETARRVWPGEWEDRFGALRRQLIRDRDMGVHLYLSHLSGTWYATLGTRGYDHDIALGTSLETVLITVRDHVQAIARAFAASVGVT